MKPRDQELVRRILRYCQRISDYLQRIDISKESFLSDPMVQDACCMCIVQIGELCGLLSEELRQRHPEIPWRAVKDTRNFYVHNYGSVDINFVWDTVTNDIPGLQRWCNSHSHDNLTDF